jgi:transcriptional regulator with GAF, ATPase, and Fis domain
VTDTNKTAVLRVLDIVKAVVSGRVPRRILDAALDSAIELADAERGFIARPGKTKLEVLALRARGQRALDAGSLELGTTFVPLALRAKRALLVEDPRHAPDFWLRTGGPKGFRARSALVAPLVAGGETHGAIVLSEARRETPFDETDRKTLEAVSVLAAQSLSLLARNAALEEELAQVRPALPRHRFKRLVGSSDAMEALAAKLEPVCASDATVLVLGETGTGKELVAQTIHEEGKRQKGPFVAFNVAELPESLLESELFGHARGAFTDAKEARDGLFVAADGGTLFLDEVGDMPPALQVRLLRAIQERRVRPVGSPHVRKVDVRIVAATHRDLEELVAKGTFREDLYHRLAILRLDTPPLRERREDVPLLADHFLRLHARANGKPVPVLGRAAVEALLAHRWPGNVRELSNAIERAVVLGRDPIEPEDLSLGSRRSAASSGKDAAALHARALAALREAEGNASRAAKLLKIGRATFYRWKNGGAEPRPRRRRARSQ